MDILNYTGLQCCNVLYILLSTNCVNGLFMNNNNILYMVRLWYLGYRFYMIKINFHDFELTWNR